jgi:hypothetical protein
MLGDRQRHLIQVTLAAAAPYGAALGGRGALAVHGLSRQTTRLIDVVTIRDTVPEAAAAVQAALRQAGYQTDRQAHGPELENTWPGGRDTAAQWHVRKPEPHDHPPIGGITGYTCPKCFVRDYLGLSRAPRSRDPVPTGLGPVLHPEDAAGAKVADLARRGRIRDYASTADLLEHYSPAQLIGFARRLDPSLDRQDFANLARRLDQFPEVALTAMGALEPPDVPRLRDRFADWPRDARDIERQQPRQQERERPGPGQDTADRPAARHQRSEPGQEAKQPPELVAGRQPQRTEPARPEPDTDSRAAAQQAVANIPLWQPAADRRHAASLRRRDREAEHNDPEVER